MQTRYSLSLIFLLTASFTLSSCSHMPTLTSTKTAMVNMKKKVAKSTHRLFVRKKPRYPAALPLRRVSARTVNTCPPPQHRQYRRTVKTRNATPRHAAMRNRAAVNKRPTVRQNSKAVQRARTVAARTHYPAPRPQIRHARYTPPVPQPTRQAPRINPQQANQLLFNTAKKGSAAQIINLINQGANVNAANGNGETALHAAASTGNLAAAQALLQHGANVNAQTIRGWTPLHTAARFGRGNVAALLLNRGAQRNSVNADGRTPMQLARQANQQGLVAMLQR